MPDEREPSEEELAARKQWFDGHVDGLEKRSVLIPAVPGVSHACPCCRFLTLGERGAYEICPVCFWEDDGQDDADPATSRGGPNGTSLAEARRNYAAYGACDEKAKEHVRPPTDSERPGPA